MKKLHRLNQTLLAASISVALVGCSSSSSSGNDTKEKPEAEKPEVEKPEVATRYTGYPVTLNPNHPDAAADTATQKTSLSYKGQMSRHAMRESLKSLLSNPGDDVTNTAEMAAKLNKFLKNENGVLASETIVAPTNKNDYAMLETTFNDLSGGKSLYKSLYDHDGKGHETPLKGVEAGYENIVMGVPGNKTPKDVTDLWVANAAEAFFDSDRKKDAKYTSVDFSTGMEYNQLMAKFMMGAIFYNQAVDKYLDDFMAADIKPNNKPYGKDKHYTGKEHSWDEGFGYFGAAANYGELTAEQNYNIKKQKDGTATHADWNKDGKVSIYTEYTSGPAYYAADSDKTGRTSYGKDIMDAFLAGRHIIANATDDKGFARALTAKELSALKGHAATIQRNWEMVFAEAVYKYAGLSYKDIETWQGEQTDANLAKYYHHWSEGKGLMLALQFGGTMSKINKAKFMEIDDLWGYGPVMGDGSQVTGVTGTTFTTTGPTGTANEALDAYQLKLKQIQEKLDEFYKLKAKQHKITN